MTLIHSGTQPLETPRLILRKFTLSDAEDMYQNWASDPLVTRYLAWKTHANIEITNSILQEWVENYQKDNFYNWAIVLKEGNKLIGSIGIVRIDDQAESVEVGYCISKNYWKKGLVSEALGKVIDYFFQEIHANRIEATHHIDNPASGKVMRKNGLIPEGIRREVYKNLDGSFSDMIIYSLLQKKWKQQKR